MFHVGQKVVCVDDKHQLIFDGDTPVVEGVTYEVRYAEDDGLALEGITNSVGIFGERLYWSRRFRPLRENSIECFRALLNTKPSDLPAERDLEVAR